MLWDMVSGVHSLPHLLLCLKGELKVLFFIAANVLLKDPNGSALSI